MSIDSIKKNSIGNSSDVESFESSQSFKQSINDRFDLVNAQFNSVNDRMDSVSKELKDGLDKMFKLFNSVNLGNTEFDARNHDVSSLADKSLNDVQATDATADEATNFIEKPHFSSQNHSPIDEAICRDTVFFVLRIVVVNIISTK